MKIFEISSLRLLESKSFNMISTRVFKNPSPGRLKSMFQSAMNKSIRGVFDYDNNIWIWPAVDEWHHAVKNELSTQGYEYEDFHNLSMQLRNNIIDVKTNELSILGSNKAFDKMTKGFEIKI